MCEILVSLQHVINYYNGNLAPLVGILKQMNQKVIVDHTLFEWPDLVGFILSLYLNYFSKHISEQYLQLYRENFEEISSNFENFLQAYYPYF